jgi:hypothetical protein
VSWIVRLRKLFQRAPRQQPLEQPQKGLWKPSPEGFVEPFKDVKQVSRTLNGDKFLLDSGREVFLLECHVERSALGWLCGRMDDIRAEVIKELPARIRRQFPNSNGHFIKPIPEGDLPVYTFMASLESRETVGIDPENIGSRLVVCWFGNHIDDNLVDLIAHEIRSVDWDKYAENWLP